MTISEGRFLCGKWKVTINKIRCLQGYDRCLQGYDRCLQGYDRCLQGYDRIIGYYILVFLWYQKISREPEVIKSSLLILLDQIINVDTFV